MDQEIIYTLLQRGVIEEANHSHGEFLSMCSSDPRKMGALE